MHANFVNVLARVKQDKLSAAALILGFFAVCAYFIQALGMGFWRPDAWGYSVDELSEFRGSQRWLAPFFHHYLRELPLAVGWICFILGWWVLGYRVAKNYLGANACWMLASTVALVFVINPSLIGQSFWPLHSLAALIILLLMDQLRGSVSKFVLIPVGTVCLYAILQSFAFLTLIFLLPTKKELEVASLGWLLKRGMYDLSLWVGSLVAGVLVAKLAQLIYFGEITGLLPHRNLRPVATVSDLIGNLIHNLEVFWHHFLGAYSLFGILTFSVLVFGGVALIAWKRGDRSGVAKLLAVMAFYSLPLALGVYLITAPLGSLISFRSGFGAGCAIFIALLVSQLVVSDRRFLYLCMFSLLIPAFGLSYANFKRFSVGTGEIVATISEFNWRGADKPNVYIVSSKAEWPITWEYSTRYYPKLYGRYQTAERSKGAFWELGLPEPIWCVNEKRKKYKGICEELRKPPSANCSKLNSRICVKKIDLQNFVIFID
ncbi:hypothetical protein [uncultured Microbulbifer sp.]|uniref:hypothetical protein n=1 Tax=uncultured Microbulbifer sp. TaxID=348147 RepID=UPI00262A777F|nr:hypothetical protein [uncultured Microbulbifer sp.]